MIDTETAKTEAQIRKEELEQFVAECAKRLTLPETCDKSDILTAIERQILDREEEQRMFERKRKETQEEVDKKIAFLLSETKRLTGALEIEGIKMQEQVRKNTVLQHQVEELKIGVNTVLQEKKKTLTFLERITGHIKKINLVESL